ncbi:TonB-dependent receptor [Sphingomonas xinjiangensis]|uniref:TonB-dependent receptor n=1 Tax=Sphingomonas xinjiangensis TaxID=643568 RepID=A0A840YIB6_9SPHN|nr:TonB-dependent receptor [Sphingomonas xinjiangensis]MBB5711809.1 TonB-dependent receptor [Sphingomonas xinjiangensis]
MRISKTRICAIHLLCGTSVALLVPVAAWADPIGEEPQTTPGNSTDAPSADEIVIHGRRDTVRNAQDEQVKSQSFATIVSGEELRAQPQQNLADLLTRLPGVNSSVDQSRNAAGTGEAQYLSIRGLDTSYNAYLLDGVRLAQTDARTRAISMNLLSPFALASVRVDKAPTANFDGDAIAGLIDLRTATAFDLPEHHFQVRAQGQAAGRAMARDQDGLGGSVQLEAAHRFGDFGVFASAYYGVKHVLGESTAMQHDWEKYNNNIPGMIRNNLDNLTPRGVQWQAFRNRIERLGGTLNLDWDGENISLYLRSTYGRYNLKSWMDQTALRQTDLAPDQINPNPNNRGSYDAAGFRADYGLTATHYFRTEHSNQELFSTKLGGQSKVGNFTFDYHGAYSRGEQDYPLRIQSGFSGRPYIGTPTNTGLAAYRMVTAIGDRTSPQVVLTDAARATLTDLSTLKQWYVTQQFENAWERRLEGGFDAAWHHADQGLVSIAAGAKVEDAKRYSNSLGDDGALQYTFLTSTGANSPRYAATGPSIADLPGELLGGFMHGSAQVPIKLVDTKFIEDQVRRLSTPKLASLDPNKLRENRLDGTENRIGAYAMATLQFGELQVVPGVRYEYNRFEGTYWQDQGTTAGFVTSNRNYDQWLPGVIANYRPSDGVVVRASVRKSYSRPAFDLLLGPTRINRNDVGEVTGIFLPNPDLDAQESWNFDTSLEIQGSGTDFFSISPYYKKLKHVLFSTGTTNAGGDYNIWGAPQSEEQGGVEVSRLSTDATGKVYGVELFGRYSLKGLPEWLSGLGLQGNVTLQRADAKVFVNGQDRNQRMPQAPRVMYNAALFYGHAGIYAELNYNYTGDRLYDLRSDRPDTYIQPVSKANLIVNYSLPSGLTVGASVENLFDEHNYWATTSERKAYLSNDRKGGYVETGRMYMLNLTYAF